MKVFTKLGIAFLVMIFTTSVIFAQNANSVRNELIKNYKQSGQDVLAQKLIDQANVPLKYKPVKLEVKGATAYAFVAYDPSGVNPVGPAYFDTDVPGTITSLGPNGAGDFIAGGSWAEGVWYGEEYGTGALYTIDPSSGAMNLVGYGSAPGGLNAMAYDPTTQTMYGCDYNGSSSGLYSVNLTNGATTYIGDVGAGLLVIGMACDASGNLYAAELVTDILLSVNKATGAGTTIGSLGIGINYAQDLEYDNTNDVLYLAGYTSQGELYTVNPSTGACTYVGAFQGGAEMCGLAFEYNPVQYTNDVGIQSILSPTTGVNLGNEVVTVRIKNFGTAAQSNFDISYTLDGGAPVTATITTSIAGGATYDYTFAGTVDLSVYDTYEFVACTYLTGDENSVNNCKSKSVTNGPPVYCDASTTTEDEYISNVLFGSINNPSGWQGGVADYTAMFTTIEAGASEDMTITNPVPYAADLVSVWVDWNMDYTFGTDEQTDLLNVGGTGGSFTGAITVPAGTDNGDYRMRIRLMYSTSPNPCGSSTYGEVEDYTINVGGGGPSYVFEYDFEDYTAGQQVACENPTEWTTWSNAPCGTEDAYVSSDYAYSGVNSAKISGTTTDLVKTLGALTVGHYKLGFQMYIPSGNLGYFNILQDFAGASSQWGMQVYFGDDNTQPTPGVGWIDGGGALAASFNFNYNTWMLIEADVDLDQDWAEFYVDGVLIHGYVWSSGTFGTGTLNQLDGVDFFAFVGSGGTALYYFDDFEMEDLSGPTLPAPTNLVATVQNLDDVHLTWTAPTGGTGLQSYYLYRNGTQIATVNQPTTQYDDMNLSAGTYEYYVKAYYGTSGLSQPSNTATAVITGAPPAPTNLVATGVTNGIQLTWEGVGSGEWIQWDDGVNGGNGIGLTSGGTFSVASHWTPADLTPYNGFSLQKVQFFPYGDPAATFVIKAWSGANGTTLLFSQDVTSYTVDEWNEVVLTTPVLINTATDFWFGYTVTHGAGTFPAGTDMGPAVANKGDMISLSGGAWVSMSIQYGLNYNWNLAGFVGVTDGKKASLQPMVETTTAPNLNASFESAVQNGMGNGQSVKFNPNSTKDFMYNVYHKVQGGTYALLAGPLSATTYLHVAPPQGWNYYVVRTVLNGVESGNSNEVSLNWTSIEEIIFNRTQVYPNPANGIVNIKSDFDIQSVKVFNHVGQVIASESVDTKFYQFNTSHFTPGLYMFQIETNEGTITKRIIIE